jgi:argininosuccinate lyase
MTILLSTARFRPDRMCAATAGDFSTATDLADYLVRRGLPFRQAHAIVGRIVKWCEENQVTLEALDHERLRAFAPEFEPGSEALAAVEGSVASRTARGGTSPAAVRRQLQAARRRIAS